MKIFKKIRLPYLLAILPSTSPESWQLQKNPCEGTGDAICTSIINAKFLLLEVGGGIAVLLIIYAGFMYATAYGNEERAATAKKIILWTIVGIIVMIAADLIINEVVRLLS